jgi:hypothetical protein
VASPSGPPEQAARAHMNANIVNFLMWIIESPGFGESH